MKEPRNRVVQVRRFGGPDELEVDDAPLKRGGLLCAGEQLVSIEGSRSP